MKSGDFVTVLPHTIPHPIRTNENMQSPFTDEVGRLFMLDEEWKGVEGPDYLRYGYVFFGPGAAKTECWIKASHLRQATDEERRNLVRSTTILDRAETTGL
jgi:hypothetical protein